MMLGGTKHVVKDKSIIVQMKDGAVLKMGAQSNGFAWVKGESGLIALKSGQTWTSKRILLALQKSETSLIQAFFDFLLNREMQKTATGPNEGGLSRGGHNNDLCSPNDGDTLIGNSIKMNFSCSDYEARSLLIVRSNVDTVYYGQPLPLDSTYSCEVAGSYYWIARGRNGFELSSGHFYVGDSQFNLDRRNEFESLQKSIDKLDSESRELLEKQYLSAKKWILN